MNKMQKLTLALLVLGSIPGGVRAMDSDDEGEFFEDEAERAEYIKQHWQLVPLEVTPPAAIVPPVVIAPAAVPVAPVDNPVPVPRAPRPAVTVVESGPVMYLDQHGEVHNTVDPTVVPFTDKVLAKLQPLMTIKGLWGLTGLVLAIIGLRYVYVSSVIKQIADLQSLRTKCDTVLKAVLKGHIDAELVEVETVFCCGLDQELQDKLDDALSGYNIALQQVCHELCARQGDVTHSTQVEHACKAMAVCQQVIEECEQVLVKKPTIADSILKKGSVWAQALTARVKSATTAIAHRFEPQGPKTA
jgi:hypothetical protein